MRGSAWGSTSRRIAMSTIRWRAAIAVVAISLIVVASALADHRAGGLTSCGTIQWESDEANAHTVKVKATGVDCARARHIMDEVWNGNGTKGWDCDGPQTGYARCERGDKKVVGRLQY
jgi:hypothetical protein